MRDPYLVLGLNSDASSEELRARYEQLKAKYSEERFLPGERGNDAANSLSELEASWGLIESNLKKEEVKTEFGTDYGYIDSLIKNGSYDEAQSALDAISSRTGEWHYLQSIIYYKREWMNDSKAQLQIAVDMEPNNQKFRSAYDKMNLIMGNPKVEPRTIGTDPTPVPPATDQTCNNCGNCCMAYCLADCCCSLCQAC